MRWSGTSRPGGVDTIHTRPPESHVAASHDAGTKSHDGRREEGTPGCRRDRTGRVAGSYMKRGRSRVVRHQRSSDDRAGPAVPRGRDEYSDGSRLDDREHRAKPPWYAKVVQVFVSVLRRELRHHQVRSLERRQQESTALRCDHATMLASRHPRTQGLCAPGRAVVSGTCPQRHGPPSDRPGGP